MFYTLLKMLKTKKILEKHVLKMWKFRQKNYTSFSDRVPTLSKIRQWNSQQLHVNISPSVMTNFRFLKKPADKTTLCKTTKSDICQTRSDVITWKVIFVLARLIYDIPDKFRPGVFELSSKKKRIIIVKKKPKNNNKVFRWRHKSLIT